MCVTEGVDPLMTLTRSRLIETIAAACHQQNKVWCEAAGDLSQPNWSEAPDWQRQSAIAGIEGALKGNTPEQSHEGWLRTKAADGWVWGPTKNAEKKTHPCMVPYSDLPPIQQAKDLYFVTMARELGRIVGLVNRSESNT